MTSALLSLLVAAVAVPPALSSPVGAQVVREVLPNGVRVIVLRDRKAPLVAARAVWSGGGRREPIDMGGVSAILAAAWTGGCGDHDPEALDQKLRADDASMAGFAGRDVVGLRAEWMRGGWEEGLQLLADCVAAPHFAAPAFARARSRALERGAERTRNPTWIALDLLAGELDGASSGAGGLSPADADGASPLDRRQLEEHYRAHYPISAMTLAVVGDVDPASIVAAARARFGTAEARPRAPLPSGGPPAGAGRELYRHLADGGPVASVALGFPAVGRAHPDRAALEVAAGLIAGGARSQLISDADVGLFVVHRSCRPDRVPSALAALRREVDRLRGPGLDSMEVQRIASELARARRDALARSPQAAALVALYEVLGPGAEHAARHAARLVAVRPADVRVVAERYLRAESAVVATALPLQASPGALRRSRELVRPPPTVEIDVDPPSRSRKAPTRRKGKGRVKGPRRQSARDAAQGPAGRAFATPLGGPLGGPAGRVFATPLGGKCGGKCGERRA